MSDEIVHITWGRAHPSPSGPGGMWLSECMCGWTRDGRYARSTELARATAEKLAEAYGVQHQIDVALGAAHQPEQPERSLVEISQRCHWCGHMVEPGQLSAHMDDEHGRPGCQRPTTCSAAGACTREVKDRSCEEPVDCEICGDAFLASRLHRHVQEKHAHPSNPGWTPLPPRSLRASGPTSETCTLCGAVVRSWFMVHHMRDAHPVKDGDE